jgi:hypothetical protein
MPLIFTYWGPTPEADPYRLALITAAKWNSIAAFFGGLSALCASASWAASRTLGAHLNQTLPLDGDLELREAFAAIGLYHAFRTALSRVLLGG